MPMTTDNIVRLAPSWSYVSPIRGTPEGYFYHIRSLVERPNNWANLGRNSWEVETPAWSYAPDPDFLPTIDSSSDTPTRTNAAEAENSNASILKLPIELFMSIADLLELTDLMSFQSTCRHIARQVDGSVKAGKSVATNGTTGDQRNERISQLYNQYFWRLRKDRFAELAALEQANDVLVKEKLLCVWCTDFHAASKFHQDQVSRNAHERMCIGATATVYVCPHTSLTFAEILDIKAACKASGRSSPVLCAEETCRNARLWYNLRSAIGCLKTIYRVPIAETQPVIKDLSPALWAGPNARRIHRRISEVDNWSSPLIQRGLVKLDAYVCPHLRTSDIECYDLLLASIYQADTCASWGVLREGDAYWPMGVPAGAIKCEAEDDCGASFLVRTSTWSLGEIEVNMDVERRLMVDTVRSRRWSVITGVSESALTNTGSTNVKKQPA
ncbi:uncharacterized protein N0V89_005269 [Didymosphaeria variabile]|uniref:F-box domain-containing protein n=1 Tax=Didymosphaeria variabile TaxID=1932322 RepID=A0A9W8XL61_9PLEO|nr:uncharacterized protein N0V89_005269 [Didymosphaeria variabile]KAJ4353539.1 hypothetical protein N0V89_005269 [Didymosphaeria variabile]